MKRTIAIITMILLGVTSVADEQPSEAPFHNVAGFVAGTTVATARGPAVVQALRPNDRVLSLDPQTGTVVESRILRVSHHRVDSVVELIVGDEKIYANAEHRFYVPGTGEWVKANALDPGMHVLLSSRGETLKLEKATLIKGNIEVIDFKVEGTENYFVGKNQVLVHNYTFFVPLFTWVIGEGLIWATAATVVISAAASLVEVLQKHPVDTTWLDGSNLGFPPRAPLPRDPRTREPIADPNAAGPHTQVGTKGGRSGPYTQAREFGADGKPVRDIDFTDHGRKGNHPNPHQHRYDKNPTGGTMKRDDNASPL